MYGVWDYENNTWSQDEYRLVEMIDDILFKAAEEETLPSTVMTMASSATGMYKRFRSYTETLRDNYRLLDNDLTFAGQETTRGDFRSKSLNYELSAGDHSSWDELVGTLYSDEERRKLEWAIGSIVAGDSKTIEKFLVLYGSPGSGKGTVLKIISWLFEGYTATFDAKSLGRVSSQFATESFKHNPLVAIQFDGDLSRIEDNTLLNTIISHEPIVINEKHKALYSDKINAMLFLGTNKPVKISDSKSGIIRRLIDVHPSEVRVPTKRYNELMAQVRFELGAIAAYCLEVYRELGKSYYNNYEPRSMMYQTDVMYNFIDATFDIFYKQDHTWLDQAWDLYKAFCENTNNKYPLKQHEFREELKSYFRNFEDRQTSGEHRHRSFYQGFLGEKVRRAVELVPEGLPDWLVLDQTTSIFDEVMSSQPAQYANESGTPSTTWALNSSTLGDINSSELHYVQPPENHIVIDLDLKDEHGQKSLKRNLAVAKEFPPTYAEVSKSGCGLHLHYHYSGDVRGLATNHGVDVEVKRFTGNSALRRQFTAANSRAISVLPPGVLARKEKVVISEDVRRSEQQIRKQIEQNLRKEVHGHTKPSIDFIKKILDEAHESGIVYDVVDLRPRVLRLASSSHNQSLACLKIVQTMKWKSETSLDEVTQPQSQDDRLVFFDVEVYPNLFVVCWKFQGDSNVVKMINPTASEIEPLLSGMRLVGFNNRRYDNHILKAASMGYDNEGLYRISQKIIDNDRSASFGDAYEISYADIYDFSSKKQGLKKFEIDLGLPHVEMDIPWDKPVPEDRVQDVVEYCANDVLATEAVFESRKGDWTARLILSDLSGLSPNATTQRHTARIIFGNDRDHKKSFVYTDLSKEFPGYSYSFGKSIYRDEDPSEGGYVYAEPGMYENVAVLDVASMHPASIRALNLFGDEYTKRFVDLLDARLAIKHKDYSIAREMLDGRLAPYLEDETKADELAYALKIVINIVYGLTSASFDNPFNDKRNKDNIVAKRGALFMIDLKHFVQERGFQVVHIKTDSIKIPNATPEIIEEVTLFGRKYGYDFEHEKTYDKFALVNDAVYIARSEGKWDATGAQFAKPYVYKTIFTKEELVWDDYCETKSVSKGALYLDFDHQRPAPLAERLRFVGRTGRFVPVLESSGGAVLYRVHEDNAYSATGAKGYLWLEADTAKAKGVECIDFSYFEDLSTQALETLAKFGDVDWFLAE